MKVKKIAAVLLAGAMVVGIAGCAKEKEEPIKIATKPMTEQYILGEMLTQLIEEQTGYEVELTKGIGGGTSNIQPAMEKGEFDLYPEYTSSGWIMVLGHEAGEVSDEEMLSKLQEEYEKEFDMTWIGLYGFNNTYAVVTTKEAADQYQLETCSDLAYFLGKDNTDPAISVFNALPRDPSAPCPKGKHAQCNRHSSFSLFRYQRSS